MSNGWPWRFGEFLLIFLITSSEDCIIAEIDSTRLYSLIWTQWSGSSRVRFSNNCLRGGSINQFLQAVDRREFGIEKNQQHNNRETRFHKDWRLHVSHQFICRFVKLLADVRCLLLWVLTTSIARDGQNGRFEKVALPRGWCCTRWLCIYGESARKEECKGGRVVDEDEQEEALNSCWNYVKTYLTYCLDWAGE